MVQRSGRRPAGSAEDNGVQTAEALVADARIDRRRAGRTGLRRRSVSPPCHRHRRKLGVSESVIAITLVAGGTSLPELASSVVSLAKGKAGLALGNVLGSNVANLLLILGVSATIHPLTMGGITTLDVAMVVLSSLLLFVAAFTFRRKAVDRWEGAIFVAIYAAYIWYLVR